MSMCIVRITQNRIPTELAYAVPEHLATEFLDRWRRENPAYFVGSSTLPMRYYDPRDRKIPVAPLTP